MIKYVAVAAALKAFSVCPQSKALYRAIGNTVGSRRRTRRGLPKSRIRRARRLLDLLEKHNAIHDSARLLEVGTGWIHWESVFLRLFYDVDVTLYDVWDNRQLEPLKRYFAELDRLIDEEVAIDPRRHQRVHGLLRSISSVDSFSDLYSVLGFDYVVDTSGTLDCLPDESFDVVFSCNVLEHVAAAILPGFVQSFSRLLPPGGYSVHSIDMGDHLSYYDRRVSAKNYLTYSDSVWKRLFENEVQYFNRVQRSGWLSLFRNAEFQLMHEDSAFIDLGTIAVAKRYEYLSRRDRDCIGLTVLHRKAPSLRGI